MVLTTVVRKPPDSGPHAAAGRGYPVLALGITLLLLLGVVAAALGDL